MQRILDDKNLGENLVNNNDTIKSYVTDTKNYEFKVTEEDNLGTDNPLSKKSLENKIGKLYKKEIIDDIKEKNVTDPERFFNGDVLVDENTLTDNDKYILQYIIERYTSLAQKEFIQDANEVIKTKAVEAMIKNI